jgi:signal transduction histidine kinase/ligand-binding sensor domain-containing protein/DNA-binding response OmpR family regulator
MTVKTNFISFLAVCYNFCAFGQQKLEFTSYSRKDGLSNSSIFAIAQDKDGFIWCGTRDGISRFDGTIFKSFKSNGTNNSIVDNDTRCLAYDSLENVMWIGTLDGVSKLYLQDLRFENFKATGKPGSLSSNIVRDILIDDKNQIFLATVNGIEVYDRLSKTFSYVKNIDKTIVNAECIFQLANKQRLVGTAKGVYGLNGSSKENFNLKKLALPSANTIDLNDQTIKQIIQDKNEKIWFGTFEKGLFQYDGINKFIKTYSQSTFPSLSNNSIRSLELDENDNLWIGTFNGLSRLKDGEITTYLKNNSSKSSIPDNSVKSICLAKDKTLWVGTYYGGVSKITSNLELFKTYTSNDKLTHGFDGEVVSSFAKDDENRTWIGTEGDGLFYKNDDGQYQKFSVLDEDFKGKNIKKVFYHKGSLYIGTLHHGLYVYNLTSKNLSNLSVGFQQNQHSGGNNVYDIAPFGNKLLIDAFGEGLELYDPSSNRLTKLEGLTSRISSNNVRSMLPVGENEVWLGTEKGLNRVVYDQKINKYLVYTFFKNESIISLAKDKNDHIWVGTIDRGLIRLNKSTLNRVYLNESSGLAGNSIFGIALQDNNSIWVSTNLGISKINAQSLDITNYTNEKDLKIADFNYNAAYLSPEGLMYFGGIGGFVTFDPTAISKAISAPKIVFTHFSQNNKEVEPNDGNGVLKTTIDKTESIVLDYSNSSFSLGYATLDFNQSLNNQIIYKLENFDKTWIRKSGVNELSYNIQKPGTYTLLVKSANSDKKLYSEEKRLKITVNPPFWKSGWAYLLYALAVIITIYSAFRFVKINHQLQLENLIRQQHYELNEAKLKFFTNITHEFRTPLTLINGPVEYLLKNTSDEEAKTSLKTIQKNSFRLLNLVNQILSFRKIEAGQEQLRAKHGNMVTFLLEIVEVFKNATSAKEITYKFTPSQKEIWLNFDHEKLEQVIYNLIANAVKFTKPKGQIEVKISADEEEAIIEVIDNGIGIPKELHEQIFLRFYEKSPLTHFEAKGTGIGLAISKELIEMHQGKLSVESEEGLGSRFIVCLPIAKNQLHEQSAHKIIDEHKIQIDEKLIQTTLMDVIPSKSNEDPNAKLQEQWIEDRSKVMIVEDNNEVQEFLVKLLIKDYNLISANNGNEALEKCLTIMPDIVISDVMMPEMDGISLLNAIKTRLEISHIPVVLLTARNNEEQKLHGLSIGADDYISKPFHPDELTFKIKNILAQRSIAREKFAKIITLDPKVIAISNADEIFINDMLEILEKNMDNANYNLDILAVDLAMSRSVLFAKIKNLTNQTPNNFIKNFKLKHAAALLNTEKYTVSEVCYKIGFKDQKYFRKIFFDQYGVNPSDYASFEKESAAEV